MLGEKIAAGLCVGSVLLLHGPLGSGKTTLAQGIGRGLGVTERVTSPTYTIVSEYEGRLPLYHIDLYRISGPDEYLELGLDELLGGCGVCLVEWPERAGMNVWPDAVAVDIEINDDGSRSFSGPREILAVETRS